MEVIRTQVHNREGSVYSVHVVQTSPDDLPTGLMYGVVNRETQVIEWLGRSFANAVTMCDIFDSRMKTYQDTGTVEDEESLEVAYPHLVN